MGKSRIPGMLRFIHRGTMNKTRLFFLFLFLFGTGCTPRYQDITGLTTRKVYELPTNIYYGLAWLSDKKIALAYEHDLKGAQNGAVGLYDLDSEEMIIVPQPDMPEYCIRGWNTGGLERLPDGNLGFIFDCIDDTLVDQYSLVKWREDLGNALF